MSFQKLSSIFLIFFICMIKTEVLAALATGKCPVLDVTQISSINSGKDCEYYSRKINKINDTKIFLHEMTYALIPASPEYKRISALSFNITQKNNNDLGASLECTRGNKSLIYDFSFALKYEKKNFIGVFHIQNGSARPNFFHKKANESCANWLKQPDYNYQVVYHPLKYFLIWQCAQINETTYDRALLLMGPAPVSNVSEIFEEMLIDTKLKQQDLTIWQDILWSNVMPDYSKFEGIDYDEDGHIRPYNPYYFRDCLKNVNMEIEIQEYFDDLESAINVQKVTPYSSMKRNLQKLKIENQFKLLSFAFIFIIFVVILIYMVFKCVLQKTDDNDVIQPKLLKIPDIKVSTFDSMSNHSIMTTNNGWM